MDLKERIIANGRYVNLFKFGFPKNKQMGAYFHAFEGEFFYIVKSHDSIKISINEK